MEKIQKQFSLKNRNPKLKDTTLCNEYEQGGLKDVDIFCKYQVSNVLGLKDYMATVFMPGK